MRRLLILLLLVAAGCRFAPLPPSAKLPPGYRPFRPGGPERKASAAELEAAFARRREELVAVLRGGTEENRAFAREELGRMRTVAVPALDALSRDDDTEVRAEAALALGATLCEEASASLFALAKDSEWSVREAAAQGIGRLGGRGAGAAVLPLLEDDSWRVRLAAIRALGEVGETRAVPALAKLAADVDEDVRYAAILALAHIGDPGGREALLRGLDAEDSQVRVACAEGLARAGLAEDAVALERHLLDDALDVRVAVVRSLAALHGGALPDSTREVVEGWIDALLGPDSIVSARCRQALVDIGAAAVPWLVERLHDAPDPLAVMVLDVLAAHPDPRVVAACEAFTSSGSVVVRQRVIEMLGRAEGPEAEALLAKMAAEGLSEQRARALQLLVLRKSPHGADAVAQAASDADTLVRREALHLVQDLPLERRLPLLDDRLANEKDPGLRGVVVQQIGALDSKDARKSLLDLWKKEPSLRREVVMALALHPAADARPLLLEALASSDPDTQLAAIGGLVTDADPAVIRALEGVLDRADASALWPAAIAGLSALDPSRAIARAKALLAAKEPPIRRAAVEALGRIPTPEAVAALQQAAWDADLELSSTALEALTRMPADLAAPAVLRIACEHGEEMTRATAVRAFALWGYAAAAPKLRERLGVEDSKYVKGDLVSTLGYLRDEESAGAIAEAAASDDPRLRDQAITVLGLVGTPKGVEALTKALADPLPANRSLAVEALGNLRAAEGVGPLVERLADPDEEVRRSAIYALGGYHDSARIPLLVDAMRGLHPGAQGDALRLACAKELYGAGLDDVAKAEFENVLRSEPEGGPEDTEVQLALVGILASEGDFAGAASHAQAALMMMPAGTPERAALEVEHGLLAGVVAVAEGKEATGWKAIDGALAKSARNVGALNNVAYYLASARVGLDRAAAYADEALSKTPDDPNVLDSAGWVAYLRGDLARAGDLLGRAAGAGPRGGEVPYHLARVALALGHVDEAIALAGRAVDRDPAMARRIEGDAAFQALRGDRRLRRVLSPGGSK